MLGLLAVLLGTASCRAQEKVVYRDYDRLGWTILDSLKTSGCSLFIQGNEHVKTGCSYAGREYARGCGTSSCRETRIKTKGNN